MGGRGRLARCQTPRSHGGGASFGGAGGRWSCRRCSNDLGLGFARVTVVAAVVAAAVVVVVIVAVVVTVVVGRVVAAFAVRNTGAADWIQSNRPLYRLWFLLVLALVLALVLVVLLVLLVLLVLQMPLHLARLKHVWALQGLDVAGIAEAQRLRAAVVHCCAAVDAKVHAALAERRLRQSVQSVVVPQQNSQARAGSPPVLLPKRSCKHQGRPGKAPALHQPHARCRHLDTRTRARGLERAVVAALERPCTELAYCSRLRLPPPLGTGRGQRQRCRQG